MYNYIKGKVVEKYEGQVVLECFGVGYEILMSSYSLETLNIQDEEVKIFTYYHVKEDGVALFGFLSQEEKDIFLKLISVGGVGPKGAIAILSSIKFLDLAKVIAMQDLIALSKVKGVGKKTAERILVELKDKIDILPMELIGQENVKIESSEIDDACEVLVSLGLTKIEAKSLAQEVYCDGDSAEDIVAKSLQQHR